MPHATTINVVGPSTVWHIGWHALGIAVITDSLRWAAAGKTHASTATYHVQRIEEAVLFLEGTALDVSLELFGISYHADAVRDAFNAWLKSRQTPFYP